LFIATQNRDSLKIFSKVNGERSGTVETGTTDSYIELIFSDGRKERIELYYGSGYLSQSSRKQRVPKGVKEIRIYNYSGESRVAAVTGI
jgi:hypothetical protein